MMIFLRRGSEILPLLRNITFTEPVADLHCQMECLYHLSQVPRKHNKELNLYHANMLIIN